MPHNEWSVGYGTATALESMTLVADWGGGAYSPDATARVGRLMLRKGDWNGRQLLAAWVVEEAIRHAGLPNHSGLGWWVNREMDGSRHWKAAHPDAFWGAGAGHQILLIIPSLNLIVVRNGEQLDKTLSYDNGLETRLVTPLMQALAESRAAPYPPSPVIKGMDWAPKENIIRKAQGSDNWPLTWADDDSLFTAYGDGNGFEPGVPEKLSLGFAKVSGLPPDFTGVNIRALTGEQKGEGQHGRKAGGVLMVEGVLYLWARTPATRNLPGPRNTPPIGIGAIGSSRPASGAPRF